MRIFFCWLFAGFACFPTAQAGIFDKQPKALETLNLSYGKHERQVLDVVHLAVLAFHRNSFEFNPFGAFVAIKLYCQQWSCNWLRAIQAD